MILLGLDTATESTSLALCKAGQPPFSVSFSGPQKQVESIATGVQSLFEASGIAPSAVNAVALDVGPGLFTGLRVGLSFAKSFAGALGIPIVPASSLDIVAFSQKSCPKLIVALIDARRGEVFYAMYRRLPGSGIARISPMSVAPPDNVVSELESMGEPALLVGQGAIRYRDAFSSLSQVHFAGSAVAYPLMPMLFEIAFPLAVSERFVSPDEVDAVYIRDADAKVNFEVRHSFGKKVGGT